jgi:hypothetical protein
MARKSPSGFRKASRPVTNRRQNLRKLINNTKWRLLVEEKGETLIKLSRSLENDDWPEGTGFTFFYSEIERTE